MRLSLDTLYNFAFLCYNQKKRPRTVVLEYTILYSNRKTISISVEKCEVVVRAPNGTDAETIGKAINKHLNWIEKHIEIQRKKESLFSGLTQKDIDILKKNARRYFADKTEYFAKIMGIKYGRITITSAQKRFGSCSSAGNISYSYRLMLYPEPAREYVIVHELAHIKEMNHSKRFYDIIASVLPDYKKRKHLLK